MTQSLTRYRPYRPREVATRVTASLPRDDDHVGSGLPAAERFTIGLEEELFLVDASTLDCVSHMSPEFYRDAKAALGDQFKREIISSMVELITAPHTRLSAVADELVEMRAVLGNVASLHGLALLACGTHPFADWRDQTMTDKPRYDLVAGALGTLSKRVHVCGLHIHVAIPDPARRISVMNRAQQFLPLFLALSTSSPFWRGAATGLKSYRSAANDETPRTGLPTRFSGPIEFDRYVEKLTAAGFIPDQSFLWWAIRPSLKYPTLELRIADSCTNWRDAIAIAALYRCLVHALDSDPAIASLWENHHYLVNNENRWQAIRFGLEANMLDPAGGPTRSVRERTHEMVEWLQPSAADLGCVDELDDVIRILAHGTGAEQQTSIFDHARATGAGDIEAIKTVAADIAELTLAASSATYA